MIYDLRFMNKLRIKIGILELFVFLSYNISTMLNNEGPRPTNADIEQFWNGIPTLAQFVNLKPDESIASMQLIYTASKGRISRSALLIKTRTIGEYSVFAGAAVATRSQLIRTNRWFKSIPTSLLADTAIVPIITAIGSTLIRVEDIIKPELPSKPTV